MTETRRKTERFKAKPHHPSPKGGPWRGESCIYRQHSSIQEISSAFLTVLLAVKFPISLKLFTVLLQIFSDTSKITLYKLHRCHRQRTEAPVGNVTRSIPPRFGNKTHTKAFVLLHSFIQPYLFFLFLSHLCISHKARSYLLVKCQGILLCGDK